MQYDFKKMEKFLERKQQRIKCLGYAEILQGTIKIRREKWNKVETAKPLITLPTVSQS